MVKSIYYVKNMVYLLKLQMLIEMGLDVPNVFQ